MNKIRKRNPVIADNFSLKKGVVIASVFLILNILIIGIIYLIRPKIDVIGLWVAKTDSTEVFFELNDNKTGKIELKVRNEVYNVEIVDFIVIKSSNEFLIHVSYGAKNNYPAFFYNMNEFEVQRLTRDSLYLFGYNKQNSWKLRMEKNFVP